MSIDVSSGGNGGGGMWEALRSIAETAEAHRATASRRRERTSARLRLGVTNNGQRSKRRIGAIDGSRRSLR